MATALDIAFLFVYVLGAFAYGSATILSLRQASPVWAPHRRDDGTPSPRLDLANLTLFAWSAVWFVVVAIEQFDDFVSGPTRGWLDLTEVLLVFGFPPLIMHSMAIESHAAEWPEPARRWGRRAVGAGYVLSGSAMAFTLALILGTIDLGRRANDAVSLVIAGLFTMAGVFSAVALRRNPRGAGTYENRSLRRTLNGLFIGLVAANLLYVVGSGSPLAVDQINQLMAVVPLLFLSASTYHENKVEFYDLLVKRGALLLVLATGLGVFFTAVMPWLDALPHDGVRPWLYALLVLPAVMAVPWAARRLGARLDRAWFGRHHTPVSAVTTVLAAMQSATDEGTLLSAAETSLKEVLGVTVRLTTEPPAESAPRVVFEVEGSVVEPSVWVTVPAVRGERVLLSEDLRLLRSLGTVVTYMVENVRLQARRQEQDLREQELRVQTSQSELKALRAQINPHFLFNALNTVASLIHSDPARADRAVEQLSEVFRHTLRRSDSEWASLDQELAFAQAYLDVEEARFGARLHYRIEADAGARRACVPSMLIHTLVENAVKHGIAQLRGQGRLDIEARTAGGRLVVEVRDNGPGPEAGDDAMPFARRPGEQFGLRSVRDRLTGHFGADAAFSLTRDGTGERTVARVEMPIVHADERRGSPVEVRA